MQSAVQLSTPNDPDNLLQSKNWKVICLYFSGKRSLMLMSHFFLHWPLARYILQSVPLVPNCLLYLPLRDTVQFTFLVLLPGTNTLNSVSIYNVTVYFVGSLMPTKNKSVHFIVTTKQNVPVHSSYNNIIRRNNTLALRGIWTRNLHSQFFTYLELALPLCLLLDGKIRTPTTYCNTCTVWIRFE